MIIGGSSRWSHFSSPSDRLAATRAFEQVMDGAGGQGGLGQEPEGRTRSDQIRVVLLGVGGDQDRTGTRFAVQPSYDLEAALTTEVDVNQRDVRPEIRDTLERLGAARGDADDGDALALQQTARGVQEARAVVDNETTQHHVSKNGKPPGHRHPR